MDNQLFISSLFLVVGSGLLNAICGFFIKSSKDKSVFLGSMLLLPFITLTPSLIIELVNTDLPVQAYVLVFCSMALQFVYGLLLSKAYTGDLSQVYPIMRGTGVILTPIIGVSVLGESLSLWGWAGVCGIVTSIFALSGWNPLSRSSKTFNVKPALFALLVGVCITSYTIVDKLTLAYLSPLSLLQVGNIGILLVFLPHLLKRERLTSEWKLKWKSILIGSLIQPGSYLLFLFAIDIAPVSHLAPVREIGTVFAALLGIVLLKEKQGWRRIVASSMITICIIIVGMRG